MAGPSSQAPRSQIPQENRDAALQQTKMNIRILALKYAKKLCVENMRAQSGGVEDPKEINAVALVAQAGIIEEYLIAGILAPANPSTVQ